MTENKKWYYYCPDCELKWNENYDPEIGKCHSECTQCHKDCAPFFTHKMDGDYIQKIFTGPIRTRSRVERLSPYDIEFIPEQEHERIEPIQANIKFMGTE